MGEGILDIFSILSGLLNIFPLVVLFLVFLGVNWAKMYCLKVMLLLLTVSLFHPAL